MNNIDILILRELLNIPIVMVAVEFLAYIIETLDSLFEGFAIQPC